MKILNSILSLMVYSHINPTNTSIENTVCIYGVGGGSIG